MSSSDGNRIMISRRAVVAASAMPLFSQYLAAQQLRGIRLVILDIGGTLIQDHGEVPRALSGALSKRGVAATSEEIATWRGASKRGIIRYFVENSAIPASGREAAVAAIYADFERQTESAYAHVQAIAGAELALEQMRGMGLMLATTTGFGRTFATK